MVADELALSLANRFIPARARVLDPFCGTGRLLAAAHNASLCIGWDVNPLACLLTEAKFARADAKRIQQIRDRLSDAQATERYSKVDFFLGRKVEWFSREVLDELGRVVNWINRRRLSRPELLIVASALSATARQVSFARNSGWKLHRMSAAHRKKFKPCVWSIFKKRLDYCVAQLTLQSHMPPAEITCQDAKSNLKNLLSKNKFDVVLTSPPYGDSRTTVQYGAASSLCLAIVSKLRGLSRLAANSYQIDGRCLGGTNSISKERSLKSYWAGKATSKLGKMVSRFLGDYDVVCEQVSRKLKVGGTAIFVVGRRSTGGFRLLLDLFTIDCFKRRGFQLVRLETRKLKHKRVPRAVNRYARSKQRKTEPTARAVTMNSEIIVVLKKRKISRREG